MSWRTIAITGRAKLDFKLGYMVVRKQTEQRLFLDDISVIILESTAISLTTHLIKEIINRKIKVVFCDEFHNPIGEVSGLFNHTSSSANILEQIKWNEARKGEVWCEIIREKIYNQAKILYKFGESVKAEMLISYANDVKNADITNREGHSAKVYFNALFGNDFSRGQDSAVNAALNYGYSLILSVFNREIVASGYLTQLGISHHNTYNHFNFSCDLMEPFRPFVDNLVRENDFKEFTSEQKHIMLNLLSTEVIIEGQKNYILKSIAIYTKSVINTMNNTGEIKFVEFYKEE